VLGLAFPVADRGRQAARVDAVDDLADRAEPAGDVERPGELLDDLDRARGDDVDVAGVEGRDGYRAAPEDEVLGVLADLAEGKDVVLCHLMEADCQGRMC
jgi:hypothetical protein